ncbi:MAG: MmgE/PrpD family protein [Thermoplasmata archaeon]|nr:MmgE/PrpD family protein [Thermoplasmata archaeon]
MTLADKIYEFASDSMEKEIDTKTMDEIKKRIVDSIYVSYGARKAEPVKISLDTLLPSKGKLNSVVYFYNKKGSVDVVTFLNGCMTRYLDYNDTYLSKEALHPSDNIPPIIAYSHAKEKNGIDAIKAIYVAYQVVGALSDAVSIRDRGWDHVTYISISSAAGLAALNNLDNKKFVNALNLAINNNISLRQTRAGELSMWKGCTAANASRNSVFATMLAENGFTGPGPIFEGEMGFFKQVSGEFDLNLEENRVLKTMIKNYPVEYHAMSAVDAALKIHNKMKGNRIESIDVETFSVAYKIIVKDPEKLRPKTKETADHSMPYIIAYTLLYGEPNLLSYTKEKLEDRKILDLIDKMKVNINPEYDKMYPEYLPVKISVITDMGKYNEEVLFPKGHFKSPYDWDDLLKKGTKIMNDEDQAREILNAGKRLEKISVKEFLDVVNNVKAKR